MMWISKKKLLKLEDRIYTLEQQNKIHIYDNNALGTCYVNTISIAEAIDQLRMFFNLQWKYNYARGPSVSLVKVDE